MSFPDTIYALSSGFDKSAVSIIRTSGRHSLPALRKLVRNRDTFPHRHAALCDFFDPQDDIILDKGLALYFKAPASYTGEDVVEYNIHGGGAVVRRFLNALGSISGLREAEPGEFTKRAFVNGKMDLTSAEAVADLVDAETEAQRVQALDQIDGGLAVLYQRWAEKLKRSLAYAEATIDFPDEDIPVEDIYNQIRPEIDVVKREIKSHLHDYQSGERIRSGFKVAVIGPPNAGKSSLVNALARRDICITSPAPGTTRDLVEAHLDIAGYPVVMIDTAGLRPGQLKPEENLYDSIEAEGIRRAVRAARDADIRLLVFDASTLPEISHDTLELMNESAIVIFNKIENAGGDIPELGSNQIIRLSVLEETGFDVLINVIREKITGMIGLRSGPAPTRERHRYALEKCVAALEAISGSAVETELLAENIRHALKEIGRITGRTDVEDLLDVIFKDFCIGK
mgnify:CR=1 FL=1